MRSNGFFFLFQKKDVIKRSLYKPKQILAFCRYNVSDKDTDLDVGLASVNQTL